MRSSATAGAVVAVLVVVLTGCGTGAGSTAAAAVAPGGVAPGGAAGGQEPAGVLPLPVTRPVRNPDVTDATVSTTVCTGTRKYRPPKEYTDAVKRIELSTPVGRSGSIRDPRNGQVLRVPGYQGYAGLGPGDAERVELDHFLPLADGGDGYDPTNLWPEIGGVADAPLTGADGRPANSEVKDDLEYWAYRRLCRVDHGPARITLAQVEALYEPDWYATYVRLGRPHDTGNGGSGTGGA